MWNTKILKNVVSFTFVFSIVICCLNLQNNFKKKQFHPLLNFNHKSTENTKHSSKISNFDKTDFVILQHYVQVHNMFLKNAHKKDIRWLIGNLHPHAGLCNRIMHILSCLAYAIATNRVLLFDWVSDPVHMHENGIEEMAQANFDEIFQKPKINISYSNALKAFSLVSEEIQSRSVTIYDDNNNFLEDLAIQDLDKKYPQSFIFISRYDWWATPIFSNPMYKDIFFGKSSYEMFSILFKFLFIPFDGIPSNSNNNCDWLIQYRTVWDRKTAPLQNFIDCASNNGFEKNNQKMILSTDKRNVEFDGNLIIGCRQGQLCDKNTIQSMYHLATCKNAVLTFTSTFGQCITGLGQLSNVYMMNGEGECSKKKYIDPIDAGVLPYQKKQIQDVINNPQDPHDETYLRAAFVYMLLGDQNEDIIDNMKKSISSLDQYFNQNNHYSIVVFTTDYTNKYYLLQQYTTSRVFIVPVPENQWKPPNLVLEPLIFRLKSAPHHPGFNVNYRLMSRWTAGFLYTNPFLQKFHYFIKLDHDTFATSQWLQDPFLEMSKKNKKVGYWMGYSDIDDVTENLWDTMKEYIQINNITIKQPNLLFDKNNKYLNTNFYGCFVGLHSKTFKSQEYKNLFNYLDSKNGFLKYRWDEQKILVIYTALYLESTNIEFFDYVKIEHQVWATQPVQWIGY